MPPLSALPPASRAEWLGARAALAAQRSARLAAGTLAAFVLVLGALFALRFSGRADHDSSLSLRALRDRQADSVSMFRRADSAHRTASRVDSLYSASLRATGGSASAPGTATLQFKHDSLLMLATQLDTLIARAANAPLPASFRSLAAAAALHGGTRTARLLDSLDALEARRAALAPTGGTDEPYAALTSGVNDVGAAIRAAAVRRRAGLTLSLAALDSTTGNTAPRSDSSALSVRRDSAHAAAARLDSALEAIRMPNASPDATRNAASEIVSRRTPLVAAAAVLLVAVLIAGFSIQLAAEMKRPIVATPREAERAVAAPVMAVVRDASRAPRPGGIDPFRMLYLGLTATGTRTRTVVVGGRNRAVVANVAARLALAAAADARATLLVDADTEGGAVARYFGQPSEPGLSDALAGVRAWRDVTRSVGARDGLAIDVMPGGTLRLNDRTKTVAAAVREEFERFRSEYDISVIAAPSEAALVSACSLLERPATVLCALLGEAPLEELGADADFARQSGAVLHGVTVWDAKLPASSVRSELPQGQASARARRPNPGDQ